MRIDYADVETALKLFLSRRPEDRQFALVRQLREFIFEEYGVEETSAWITARLRELERRRRVEAIVLWGGRGGCFSGWQIGPGGVA